MLTRMIPPAPIDVHECRLVRLLREKSTPADGIAERIETLIRTATPLLDLVIAGPFRDYTLHNPAHAKKLVHLCEYLMPEHTITSLSPLELAVVIASCYLHDLGMALTGDEREKLLETPDFLDTLRIWPVLSQELQATRLRLQVASESDRFKLEARLFQLQEAALAAYLRGIHATRGRYVELIRLLKDSSGRNDLFEVGGVSYDNELIEICVSHNLDVGVLLETRSTYQDRFPRDLALSGFQLNTQFCAALLRLSDILDFDRERTPRILFESLNIGDSGLPGAAVSLLEWKKHLAVHTIGLSSNEIVISADSSHPAIERSIRDFCLQIEREIRDTLSVLRRNPTEIGETYRIDLALSVRAQVRSLGYVYRDLAFRLNESSISKILMGEGLYANKAVALRELIQNSIDACRVKAVLGNDAGYKPSIAVTFFEDSGSRFWIEVTDNGIGMDEFVLSNYFFRIGDSYYSSPDFGRMLRDKAFTPISRFGIGVLSIFMIGDVLEVATRNVNSPRGDTTYRIARIEGRFGLAFVTEELTGPEGTRVRVRLAFDNRLAAVLFLSQAASYLRETVRRPAVPININLPNGAFILDSSRYARLNEEKLSELQSRRIEPIVLNIERWSQSMTGRVILFFHVRPDGMLSRAEGDKKTLLSNREMIHFLTDYTGNRLTVNGISMALKKLGRILGAGITGKEQFAIAIDVEIAGTEDIRYDVARKQVVGPGIGTVRIELRKSILKGLRALGVLDRLDEDTRLAIESPKRFDRALPDGRPRVDPAVLTAVRDLIPATRWPIAMHHTIAARLGISPGLVYRAISALLLSGQIKKRYSTAPENIGTLAENTEQPS